MSSNSNDINQLLQQITLTDINDENNKAVKVKNTFIETIQVNGTTVAGANSFISTNNQILTPTTSGMRIGMYYDNYWYLYSSLTMTVDVVYIDFDYNEQIYQMTTVPSTFVRIPFNARNIQNLIRVGGNNSGTAVMTREPVEIYASGQNFTTNQLSQGRSFNPLYMVPRGYKVRLNSIDYFRNVSPSTVSLLKYNKYIGNYRTAEEPVIVFQIVKADGIISTDMENQNYFTEGECLIWYNTDTTSTATTLNSSFEKIKI